MKLTIKDNKKKSTTKKTFMTVVYVDSDNELQVMRRKICNSPCAFDIGECLRINISNWNSIKSIVID